MYRPDIFKDEDPGSLRARITAHPLGTLILHRDGTLDANHLPFVLIQDGQEERLQAHIPRANPLSQLTGEHPVLVIFHGPQGYISPSWYATKAEHGKVVPTWNYAATHVHGTLRVVDDAEWVSHQIARLTTQQEAAMAAPWSIEEAPADYLQTLTRALVGIEINITGMEGKNKASQNQPTVNQRSVLARLQDKPDSAALHRMMEATLGGTPDKS